jgi:MGT family glycosyltransferase
MSNFLFTTWEGGGNVTPVLVVARKLLAHGHRVRVMSENCNRPEAEAAGATFIPWKRALNRKSRDPNTQVCNDWAEATPQEGLIHVIRDVWAGPSALYAQDVLEELRREPADLVATCEALFGVMAACESVNQPWVTLCPNISLAPIPGIPPLGPGLPPARDERDRELHRQIALGGQQMFDSGLPALNATRAGLGLKPLDHLLDQLHSAKVELLCTSRAFDFPATDLPSKVRYVGPQIADPTWAKPWQNPWPATDTRPLVAVSFSTTFQNHAAILQKVIDALAALDARVLITLGGSICRNDLRPAANTILVDSAPHSHVMREAAIAITHGGHGTVMRALLARLPQLVIPQGRDQNDNAVRAVHRNAGLSVMPDAPVESIRAACQQLLSDRAFRAAAKRLGDAVTADAENSTVAQELECAANGARSAAA